MYKIQNKARNSNMQTPSQSYYSSSIDLKNNWGKQSRWVSAYGGPLDWKNFNSMNRKWTEWEFYQHWPVIQPSLQISAIQCVMSKFTHFCIQLINSRMMEAWAGYQCFSQQDGYRTFCWVMITYFYSSTYINACHRTIRNMPSDVGAVYATVKESSQCKVYKRSCG